MTSKTIRLIDRGIFRLQQHTIEQLRRDNTKLAERNQVLSQEPTMLRTGMRVYEE